MAELLATAIFTAAGTTALEVGATFAVSAAVATSVVGGGATLLGGAALSFAASALSDQNKVASQQFSSRQPMPARQRSYGRQKLAGPKVQFRSTGGAFFYGTYHGEGPWDAIEEWWLDAINTGLAAGSLGGIVGAVPWRGYVGIESHLGLPHQAVSAILSQTGWGPTYRLDGCAYTAVKSASPPERKFKSFYPKGTWSELRVTARTSKVRNPADPAQTADPATWQWSQISALCIRDFLLHPLWGMRVPAELINEASFAAKAAQDAAPVTAKDGTVQPRYFLGGTYQLTDDPADVLTAMLSTNDGSLTLEPDGTIGITGGAFPVPTVTITDPAIISATIERGGSRLAAFNRLKLSYVSPPHDFQQVEAQAWDNAAAQAASGELLEQDFSRPWVQSFSQVRRLAKIYDGKGNPAWKITGMITDLSAAPALFEESVRLVLSLYGIDAVFLVTRAVANIEAGTCTFDMQSIDPEIYAFDPAREEGTPPALPNAQAAAELPEQPVDLDAVIERRAVSGGINAVFLRLTSDAPERQDLSLIGRYRQVGAADWTEMAADGDGRGSVVSSVLIDGGEYEAQGAIASYGRGAQSDWLATDPATVTATADTTSTGPATGFVVNGGAGQASYAFTAPNTPNFGSAKVYHGTTTTFAAATAIRTVNGAPSQAFDGSDNRPVGTHYYWVRAFNRSGFADAASLVGPIAVTVT